MAENETAHEQKLRVIVRVSDQLFAFLKLATKVVLWIFIAISVADIVEALAGKSTAVDARFDHNILVTFWSSLDLSCRWAWAVAIVALGYGWAQGRLRRRKTTYLSQRITQLEKTIDEHRTSSDLTATGDTPKGG